MMRLMVLRHGPTGWNADRRLQGRSDQPLSPTGEVEVRSWRLPAEVDGFAWITSPLARARRTAALLGIDATVDPAVVEMDFGAWEGRRLADLRAEDPEGVAANEARGLDFTPPGGESPRRVQRRLVPLLHRLAGAGRDTGIVTHKGVVRALLSMATGWPMLARPPVKLDWSSAHLFTLDPTGAPTLVRPNMSLKVSA